MRIGIVARQSAFASVNHVWRITNEALSQRHEMCPCPFDDGIAQTTGRRQRAKDWLDQCDAIVGPIEASILELRAELHRRVPYIGFLLGIMSHGAPQLYQAHRLMYTSDVLVGNCSSDAAICANFFSNARVRTVPFALDETVFYPTDEATRTVTRAALGLGADEKLVLYAGRLTLEKNLHTLLKVFRVVANAVPEARLVIAGEEMRKPFVEFGVSAPSLTWTLRRLCRRLDLEQHVLFVGQCTRTRLRALYSASDVLANLTLHHDENFGLAQVEALACGLPAVGTTWGGLKDTIIDGVTGAHVPAVVTSTGVKVDWWHAANRIVDILRSRDSHSEMRRRCREVARERYTMGRYRDALDDIVNECTAAATATADTLKATAFAMNVWANLIGDDEGRPPYRRGSTVMELYRSLITPFAGDSTSAASMPGVPAWCLVEPIAIGADDTLMVGDLIYPFELTIPADLVAQVRLLAARFTEQPVWTEQELDDPDPVLRRALMWMHASGLVLRSAIRDLASHLTRGMLSECACVIQHVDHKTDAIWFS